MVVPACREVQWYDARLVMECPKVREVLGAVEQPGTFPVATHGGQVSLSPTLPYTDLARYGTLDRNAILIENPPACCYASYGWDLSDKNPPPERRGRETSLVGESVQLFHCAAIDPVVGRAAPTG